MSYYRNDDLIDHATVMTIVPAMLLLTIVKFNPRSIVLTENTIACSLNACL